MPPVMKLSRFFVIASLSAAAWLPALRADTVTLKNGDRISGRIIEETAARVVVDSPVLGVLEIPGGEVAGTKKDLEEKVQAPPPEPEKEWSERYWEELTSTIFPEGFSGEIRVGYDFQESSSTESGVSLGIEGNYEVGRHIIQTEAFYDYTRRKDPDGNVTKPTDKYGLNLAYEYEIADPYFLRGSEKALVDRVKRIDLQNDLNLLGGWRAIDRPDLSVDLAAGPGLRYLDTATEAAEWSALLTFEQDASYRFSDAVRFEELFSYSVDPADTGNYSLLFELSASIRLTPFAEPRLIYRNSYDSSVGEGGVRREQAFLLSLAVPF